LRAHTSGREKEDEKEGRKTKKRNNRVKKCARMQECKKVLFSEFPDEVGKETIPPACFAHISCEERENDFECFGVKNEFEGHG